MSRALRDQSQQLRNGWRVKSFNPALFVNVLRVVCDTAAVLKIG